MWKLDFEEYFYKIYDSKKQVAGYFDPDYGKIKSPEKELEIIEQMHKNSDKITRGFLTVPMVKFGIFTEEFMLIDGLTEQVQSSLTRISDWKKFLSSFKSTHSISVSHTDQDMLSITMEVRFENPIALDKKIIYENIESILNRLQTLNLL